MQKTKVPERTKTAPDDGTSFFFRVEVLKMLVTIFRHRFDNI